MTVKVRARCIISPRVLRSIEIQSLFMADTRLRQDSRHDAPTRTACLYLLQHVMCIQTRTCCTKHHIKMLTAPLFSAAVGRWEDKDIWRLADDEQPPSLSLSRDVDAFHVSGLSCESGPLALPANARLQKHRYTTIPTLPILQWTSMTVLHTVARRSVIQLQGLYIHLYATVCLTGLFGAGLPF